MVSLSYILRRIMTSWGGPFYERPKSDWEKRFIKELEKYTKHQIKEVVELYTEEQKKMCGEHTCEWEEQVIQIEYLTLDGSRMHEDLGIDFPRFMRSL